MQTREKIKLNSGYEMPVMGLGTWQLKDRTKLLDALESAYGCGYRLIDTASQYGNEEIIGEFIKKKNRKDLFITTKLWNTDHDRVKEACEDSMRRLGIDYIDLYLIHWPVFSGSEFDVRKVWTQMEDLVVQKKVRSIGVSNFGLINLKKVLGFCKIKPAANEIELHPYLPQDEINEFCKNNDISVIGYSSLGSSVKDNSVKDDPVINEIAKKHSVSTSRILLSFCVKLGCAVIPRSQTPEHIKDNFKLIDLDDDDLKKIKAIKKRFRYVEVEEFGPHRFD